MLFQKSVVGLTKPLVGTQPRWTANTMIIMIASQKLGIATPPTAKTEKR